MSLPQANPPSVKPVSGTALQEAASPRAGSVVGSVSNNNNLSVPSSASVSANVTAAPSVSTNAKSVSSSASKGKRKDSNKDGRVSPPLAVSLSLLEIGDTSARPGAFSATSVASVSFPTFVPPSPPPSSLSSSSSSLSHPISPPSFVIPPPPPSPPVIHLVPSSSSSRVTSTSLTSRATLAPAPPSLSISREKRLRYAPATPSASFDGTRYQPCIVPDDDPLPPIVPNGAVLDRALEMARPLINPNRYCLVLIRVAPNITEVYVKTYHVTNNLPPPLNVVMFSQASRSINFYSSMGDLNEAAAHHWTFAEVDRVALRSPLEDHSIYYRVAADCHIDHTTNRTMEVASALSSTGSELMSISPSIKFPNFYNFYICGRMGWQDLLESEHSSLIVPGVEGKANTTFFYLKHKAMTNHPEVVRLHASRFASGTDERMVLNIIRDAVNSEATGFSRMDVICFFLNRTPKGQICSFGFVQVFGHALASYLLSDEVKAKLGSFKLRATINKDTDEN